MDGTGDQRVLRRRGIAAEGQPGGQAQRPRYGRGTGEAGKDLSPLVRIPSQATVDATWITSQ